MSKGSKPRPITDLDKFDSNWDNIFKRDTKTVTPLVYMVDIDETICTKTNGNYPIAVPLVNSIAKINGLYDQGHTIIYWTSRGANTGKDWTDLTKAQLDSWGCKYDQIRMGKPAYDVWIDDKAISAKDYFN